MMKGVKQLSRQSSKLALQAMNTSSISNTNNSSMLESKSSANEITDGYVDICYTQYESKNGCMDEYKQITDDDEKVCIMC